MVLKDGVDIPVDDALFLGVDLNGLVLEAIESLPLGAKPDTAFAVFGNLCEGDWRMGAQSYAFDRSVKLMADTHLPGVFLAIDIVDGGSRWLDGGASVGDADVLTAVGFQPDGLSLIDRRFPYR